MLTMQGIRVVGTTADAEDAITLIHTLSPEVVLMDTEMPKMNSIEAMEVIMLQYPDVKILAISNQDSAEYVQRSVTAGADGFILKETPADEFVDAIRAVRKGYSHYGPGLLKKAASAIAEAQARNKEARSAGLSVNREKPLFVFDPKSPHNVYPFIEPPEGESFQDETLMVPELLSLQDSDADAFNEDFIDDDIDPQYEEVAEVAGEEIPPEWSSAAASANLPIVEADQFLPQIANWLKWGGIGVTTVVMLILPFSAVLKYKTKVKAAATIRPQGEVRLVQAKTEGPVLSIEAKTGDSVEEGEIIARLDRSRLETQKAQLENSISQQQRQFLQLGSQISNLEAQMVAERRRSQSELGSSVASLEGNIRSLENRTAEVNSQVTEARAQIRSTQAAADASAVKIDRYEYLVSEGALSREALDEVRLQYQQQQEETAAAQARLNTALANLNPSTSEVDQARQSIQQIRRSGEASIAALEREKDSLKQQQVEIAKQMEQDAEQLRQTEVDLTQTDIKATAAGEISNLTLRNNGQVVQAGQEIAQIVPAGEGFEIKTAVPPQGISKLEVGQRVQMRVSTCPYPDYGLLEGRVKRISADVRTQESADGERGQPRPAAYEVFVEPEGSSFGRQAFKCNLQPGMDGSADIITREETVLRFILRKARIISNM